MSTTITSSQMQFKNHKTFRYTLAGRPLAPVPTHDTTAYANLPAVQISIEDLLDENENAHEGEEPVKEVIEMIETPSEEYMQNSFFGEDEVTPSHEEPTPAIKETKEEEVNYEENPDN